MPQSDPMPKKLEDLEKALSSNVKPVNIRLREGEYQFSLAKAIASFELELCFPNAKDLIQKLYGENRTEDPQFVSKIQTILKKMEKSDIVKILPKEKPWELQRYVLTSFKFEDVEKNEIDFATKTEIGKTRELIYSRLKPEPVSMQRPKGRGVQIALLATIIIASFAVILWVLTQQTLNLTIFASVFCIATVCSAILGVSISRKNGAL